MDQAQIQQTKSEAIRDILNIQPDGTFTLQLKVKLSPDALEKLNVNTAMNLIGEAEWLAVKVSRELRKRVQGVR